MNTNLYNHDGTLSTQAQLLLSPKPADMSIGEWRKRTKEFKLLLSAEELKEFNRVKKSIFNKKWITNNPEKAKASASKSSANWRTNNPEKAKDADAKSFAKWLAKNPEKAKASISRSSAKWRANNPEKAKESSAIWRTENPEKAKAFVSNRIYKAEYARNRRQKDPLYRFFHSIRSQAVRVVKQVGLGKKPTSTFKWVGCSPEQLKAHIESLFQEGMTWDNYGKYGWHVDHIRPVSSFKPEEWDQINHYTNLQPLWWQDNLSKSNKL